MFLSFWLDQPVWLIFVLAALPFTAISTAFWLLTHLRATRPFVVSIGTGVVPTYFGAISILVSLLLGFVANDAWERHREASRVVQSERANAIAVYDLSIASVSDMKDIRTALLGYLDAVIQDEWPLMAEAGISSPKANNALGHLLQAVADPKISTEAGGATHAALLDAVMHLRDARGRRLALATIENDETKWFTLLVLAVLTLAAIGLVHLNNPRAQAATLALFSAAMIATFSLIAMHERPFDGPFALTSSMLKRAQTQVASCLYGICIREHSEVPAKSEAPTKTDTPRTIKSLYISMFPKPSSLAL